MKKKKLYTLIAIVVAVAIIAASEVIAIASNQKIFGTIAELTNDISIDAKIQSSSISLSTDVKFESDWSTIIYASYKTEMIPDMAMFSFITCMDAQDNCRVTINGMSNTSDNDNLSFPEALGFDVVKEIFVGYDEEENANDTTKMVVSISQFNSGCDAKGYFINVCFSGTNGMSEWASNFDIGSTNSSLYKTSTVDWANKNNHKGFDVAATRAIEALCDFVKSNTNCASETTFCNFNFTGYSRGAAVANIVASRFKNAFLNECPNANTNYTCYTFATPATTTAENAGDYDYIYNFVAQQDVVTAVPMSSMGFRRYGQDFSFTLLGDENESLRAKYTEISKASYKTTALDSLINSLNGICDNRDSYYNADSSDETICYKYSYSSEASAQSNVASMELLYSAVCPENSEMYYKISDISLDSDGMYTFTLTISPAFIGQILPYALGASTGDSGISLMSYIGNISVMERYTQFISDMIAVVVNNSTGITNMHLPCQYYVYLTTLCN